MDIVTFDTIYNLQNDGSIIGADFIVNEKYEDGIIISLDDEILVHRLDDLIYKECEKILLEKGYHIVDSFIYYDKKSKSLTFEIEQQ